MNDQLWTVEATSEIIFIQGFLEITAHCDFDLVHFRNTLTYLRTWGYSHVKTLPLF